MRSSTLGNALVIAGAVIGVVTIVAIAVDYSPSLTPEMIKLLFYKGLGAAAVGMMIVGTWIARGGREKIRQAEESGVVKPVSRDQRVDDLALQEGAAGHLSNNAAFYGEKAETQSIGTRPRKKVDDFSEKRWQ